MSPLNFTVIESFLCQDKFPINAEVICKFETFISESCVSDYHRWTNEKVPDLDSCLITFRLHEFWVRFYVCEVN